ncbi:hypothetical protein L7F22_034495 [Adiantum nelumboides]|nr:hypothetical protein [Adiantum nelumboides]
MPASALPSPASSTCASSSTSASPILQRQHRAPFLCSSMEKLVFQHNTILVGGPLPYIAKLVNLQRLIMVGNNALEANIPEEVEQLTMLEQLVLNCNGHTGGVPKALAASSGLRKLRVVDLSWNSLERSILMALASAKVELQKLDLSHGECSRLVGEAISATAQLCDYVDHHHADAFGVLVCKPI